MATNQSWRLEDLQDLGISDELQQDLGLAQELESGLYLSDDFGSDSMKEILQSLIQDDDDSFYNPEEERGVTNFYQNIPPPFTNNSHQATSTYESNTTECVNCVLKVPTACIAKIDELSVTYLNRSQVYSMSLSGYSYSRTQSGVFKSTLSLEFHDLKLRNSQEGLIQQWTQDHNSQRMIEIDTVSSGGISNVQYIDDCFNYVTFTWSPQQECILSFKVHALSSEFTAKKHGGEKGILFRLVLCTYSSDTSLLSNSVCLLKVFKDKGADRKHKQDMQKRDKMDPDEAVKYWQTAPVTKLVTMLPSLDLSDHKQQQPLRSPYYSPPIGSSTQQHLHSSPSPLSSTPSSTTTPSSSTSYSLHPITSSHFSSFPFHLGPTASVDETRQWLMDNRFTNYTSTFANYGGVDLLRLSRKDLMELCGAADGIRLYNALHTRSVKRIYVSLGEDTAYHAVFLELLTVDHLREELARKLSIAPMMITAIHLQHTYGILVNVDDLCVFNMHDEQCFQMQVIKDETGSIQVILKTPDINTDISIPGLQPRS